MNRAGEELRTQGRGELPTTSKKLVVANGRAERQQKTATKKRRETSSRL
jgi:hypothetical protein